MIASRSKLSWLRTGDDRRSGIGGKGRRGRIKVSAVLLGCVVATLVAAGATPPAYAAPSVATLDQASWSARKQVVPLRNGIDLAYVEMGDPRGAPVVLLHGYTDTSRLWTILAPLLSGYRLLIPDQRGHGASSKPDCCYAPADLVHDLKLFLDAKKVQRAAGSTDQLIDFDLHEIATAQLAVDRQVEERAIAKAVLLLKEEANGPNLLRQERALRAKLTANIPRGSIFLTGIVDCMSHASSPQANSGRGENEQRVLAWW